MVERPRSRARVGLTRFDQARFALLTLTALFATVLCGYVACGQEAIPLGGPALTLPIASPTSPAYVAPGDERVEFTRQGKAHDWSVQFRIAWGGGTEKISRTEFGWWAGPGLPIRALGIEADEPGSISVENGIVVVAARFAARL